MVHVINHLKVDNDTQRVLKPSNKKFR